MVEGHQLVLWLLSERRRGLLIAGGIAYRLSGGHYACENPRIGIRVVFAREGYGWLPGNSTYLCWLMVLISPSAWDRTVFRIGAICNIASADHWAAIYLREGQSVRGNNALGYPRKTSNKHRGSYGGYFSMAEGAHRAIYLRSDCEFNPTRAFYIQSPPVFPRPHHRAFVP